MDAQEIIESALHDLGWGFNFADEQIAAIARSALDALKAAGWALVELPEPRSLTDEPR